MPSWMPCVEPGCAVMTRLGACRAHRRTARAERVELFDAIAVRDPYIKQAIAERVDAIGRAPDPLAGHDPGCALHGCYAMGCRAFVEQLARAGSKA